jgi:hydroxymethylglutaryl-CoA lyase
MTKFDIDVVEVGLRDGLQMAKGVMPTELKKRWIREAAAAGLREIEVCSFVPVTVVPGMADAAEITRFARTVPGFKVAALVPNARGAQNAIASGAQKLSMPVSVSKSHLMANIRKTQDQAVDEMKAICALRDAQPKSERVHVDGALATAFGCSIEGDVPEKDVVHLAERLVKAGVDQVTLADTVGVGNPRQVKRLFETVRKAIGAEKLGGAHFHNTRGQGLANVVAALDAGVTSFDASLGGIGGCPFAPGASGNICTEDVVWMLEEMGFKTGIDLAKLLPIRDVLVQGLPGEPIYGHVAGVGLKKKSSVEGRIAKA